MLRILILIFNIFFLFYTFYKIYLNRNLITNILLKIDKYIKLKEKKARIKNLFWKNHFRNKK